MSHDRRTTAPDIPMNTFSLPAEGIPKVSFDVVQKARAWKNTHPVQEYHHMDIEEPNTTEERNSEEYIWEEYDPEKD